MGISRGGRSGALEQAVFEANMLLTATRPEADTNGSTSVLPLGMQANGIRTFQRQQFAKWLNRLASVTGLFVSTLFASVLSPVSRFCPGSALGPPPDGVR